MNSFKVMSDAPIDALRRTLMLGVAGAPLVQLAGCGGGSSGSGSAAPPLVSSPTPGADLPIIPLGVWIGVWLNRKFSERLFLRLVYAFTLVTGLQLIFNFNLARLLQ